ncbi:hypothetical protein [Cellulomonas triticagri]|uniref:Uncharacterized protein n=1 Tax=Cellulomonas triticagri TaxID=2483352 RepID=A0A3M2JN39_9CELL|nr:hypothetical protein [Cellulomonas triticagri]RMI13230.1 hypothetical protein EBM89_05245 [Cellulomonas triticagri]
MFCDRSCGARARAVERRAAKAAAARGEHAQRLAVALSARLPRTSAQITAVRDRIEAADARAAALETELDRVRVDARRLARLARYLFLATGAPGFSRPGVQAVLGTYLTAADRRTVPEGFAQADLAALIPDLGVADGGA